MRECIADMRATDIIIVVLILTVLYLAKKLTDFARQVDDQKKKTEKYGSEIYKIRHEAREQTTEIVSKSTEKNVRQSTLFLKIRKIVSSLEPRDICQSVFDLLAKELGVTKACILLLDEKSRNYTVLSSIGISAEKEKKIVIGPHEESLVGLVIRSNVPIDVNSVQREQSFQGLVGKGQIPTVMAAPVHHSKNNDIMAILNVCEMEKGRDYTNDDKNMFNMVASLLEVAFNNSIIYETQLEVSERKELESRQMREVFGRYVSSQIIEEILKDPDSLDLGGVNKKITILAVDIRSFTKMSENFTPQEMVSMLNDYFSVMTEIVNMNHGCLDKFIGDAMMVLFGAPIAKADDCFNAVRCALEMQDAIKVFEEKWREIKGEKWRFQIGIGINYGDVVVGNIGSSTRMEYTAIGDNVNVAFRLESIAAGGVIHITDSLYNEVADRVVVEKLDPVTVKGRTQPVQIYKVLGLK